MEWNGRSNFRFSETRDYGFTRAKPRAKDVNYVYDLK